MMDRRTFVRCAVVACSAVPLATEAQGRIPRIGFLTTSPSAREESFWQELRRLGYVTDRNISVDYRSANGDFARLPELAAELVTRKVDVIVAVVTQASLAAKNATTTIPIVMIAVGDPVGSGLVTNLAHPGGNITGTSALAVDVVGKQLELLHELLPRVARVAVLANPANAVFHRQQANHARAAAGKLRLQLRFFEARTPEELNRAFVSISNDRLEALLLLPDPVFVQHAEAIATLASKHRLPTVSGSRPFAEAGVLATYGPEYLEAFRRAAVYVDKILKGARPADLPVEQSANFELLINAKAAKALGLTIPRSVRERTNEVIQ